MAPFACRGAGRSRIRGGCFCPVAPILKRLLLRPVRGARPASADRLEGDDAIPEAAAGRLVGDLVAILRSDQDGAEWGGRGDRPHPRLSFLAGVRQEVALLL